ncbi:hypothetical protein F7725_016698 [Dissostichus mawsoni]|uniref:Cytokine-like protein 1 n=1 Tax=Dissostichus mawsoni TaxID=36200 RepID=A0A7J5Z2C0_DISMA|nr:hypothetical protein F7725_016698 [Dissostichus mawsoni]
MRLGLATLVCFFSSVWLTECAPPTCYSRALGLGKEVMTLLDKIHTYHRTNSCITTKLRDFLYVVLNHPNPYCRERPRMVLLKRKIQSLHNIITRICWRDLVFFTDDCEGIDTGHSRPYYAEDRLQLLQEER